MNGLLNPPATRPDPNLATGQQPQGQQTQGQKTPTSDLDKRGLECRHCGCKHFRVIYTRPTWGGRIHAPPRMPPLRKESNDLGEVERMKGIVYGGVYSTEPME